MNFPLSLNSISASLISFLSDFLSIVFLIKLFVADCEEKPLEVSILLCGSFLFILLAEEDSRLCDEDMLALVVELDPP